MTAWMNPNLADISYFYIVSKLYEFNMWIFIYEIKFRLKKSSFFLYLCICTVPYFFPHIFYYFIFTFKSFHIFYLYFSCFFLTLSRKVKKWLCIRFVGLSVCLPVRSSVHALTVINILQMSLNLHMLFISDIEWTVLKMICIRLSVRLLRRNKSNNTFQPVGWEKWSFQTLL